MKVYIEEDELWPVYSIIPEDRADSFQRKHSQLIEIPDHMVIAYDYAYEEFQEQRARIRGLIEEQE